MLVQGLPLIYPASNRHQARLALPRAPQLLVKSTCHEKDVHLLRVFYQPDVSGVREQTQVNQNLKTLGAWCLISKVLFRACQERDISELMDLNNAQSKILCNYLKFHWVFYLLIKLWVKTYYPRSGYFLRWLLIHHRHSRTRRSKWPHYPHHSPRPPISPQLRWN